MTQRTRGIMLFTGLLLATLAAVPPHQASAQFGRTRPESGVVNVFLPAPRESKQQLSQAREALEEQRFSDAVDNLDKLLRDPEIEDYFSGGGVGDKPQLSIKGEALRLLGSMPKKGREVYELSFGAEARKLLDEAVADGDLAKLKEVTRMFFHTKAGYEANLLLGRYYLDRGRPLAGALCLARMAEVPYALDEFDPELSLLLATCWLQADNPAKAEETLVSLKSRKPRMSVRVGEKEIKLFEEPTAALAWLKQTIGERQLFAPREATQWAMFRGDAGRNAASAGGPPIPNFRWKVPTVNDDNDEEQARQVAKKYRDQGWPALPGLHPLVVQDVVLMRTPDKVMGVNFQSGKRVWEFPPWSSNSNAAAGGPPLLAGGRSSPQRETELGQRLWEDAAYGQLACDGESVFMLDGLGYAFMNYGRVFIGAGGRAMRNPGFAQPYNELVALSLKKEGKLQWKVGGESGEDEPRLTGAFFLGPPLPLHGSLYVLAEINSEIRLVALNAKTGALEWSQQLAHVDQRTILMDVTRRLAGATPSYADGVLVCPTSAGAVVAVDVSTRSLLWGYQYEQNRPTAGGPFGVVNGYPNQLKGVGNRWADATAAISEGRVLITPIESDKLYCLDLATGKLLWPALKRVDGGQELLYVAGVKDGKVVLVGKTKVTALKLADGSPAWGSAVDLSAMPSGRGFLSDRFYYVPTADAKLTKIDVLEGKLAQQTATGQPLGNLVCYKDDIVSQGVDWLYAFHQDEPLRALVAKKLVDNPNDGWALARQAEIHLHDGKPAEAVRLLRRAHELKVTSEADTIRTLLVKTLLSVLRDDFASNQQLAVEIEELVDQPSQRAELRRLMAMGLLKTGQVERAFEAFVKLSGLDDGAPLATEAARPALETIERDLSVRRDRWVQAQLASLLATANPAQRAKMDEVAQTRLDAALAADTPQSLRQFIDYFGAHPLADRARLALAKKLVDRDSFLEAELLLVRAERASDVALRSAAAAEMGRLFEKAGLVAAAPSWRSGAAQVSEQAEAPAAATTGRRAVYPIKLRDVRGTVPGGTFLAYDLNQNSLVFRDSLGKERLQVSLNKPDGARYYTQNYSVLHGKSHGHLALVSIGFDIVAVDSLRSEAGSVKDGLLWRQDLSPAALGAPTPSNIGRPSPSVRSVANPWGETRNIATDPQGKLIGETGPLNEHGVCIQRSRELHCLDPLSGETIWMRDNVDPGCQLFGDNERIFAAPPNSAEALVFSAADGSLLGKRKIEPYDNRWSTCGGRVLSWTQGEGGLTLRLTDVWSQADLWKREFPVGSRGCLVGHDEVAVLRPDGQFVLLSLADDKPRIEATLDPEPALMSLHVLRMTDQYFVATNRPATRTVAEMQIQQPLLSNLAPLIVGRVYAFDRQGRKQWQSPAAIEQFGLPLDQPADVPVLTFLRNITLIPAGKPREVRSSVLCLDRRDGRILLAKDDIPQQATMYSVVGDPQKQTVTVQLPTRTFTINFTDGPQPPEPPAQTGDASSLAVGKGGTIPGKMAEAVLNVFGRGLNGRPRPPGVDDPFDPFGTPQEDEKP